MVRLTARAGALESMELSGGKRRSRPKQRRNEDEILRKKLMIFLAAGMLAAGLSAGCGREGEDEAAPTQAAKPEDESGQTGEKGIEPALTDEAKKLYQFADLSEGDVYARIHIEDFGTITVKFFQKEAPLAVENFLTHAREGYYDGVTFHRVLDDFMIQGGDPDGTGWGGKSIWEKSFADEFSKELHPFRGALCMANSGANTNGSQFFIVQADADWVLQFEALLDTRGMTLQTYIKTAYKTELTEEDLARYELYGGTPWLFEHHTVFGQVLEGYDVLDAVAGVDVDDDGRPLQSVVISTIEVLEYPKEQ